MSSRERVRMAIAHEQPDRVPINYKANPGIDRRLKEHYGLRPDDGEGLRRILRLDFRGVYPEYKGPRLHPEIDGRNVDPLSGLRTRWIEHGQGGGYWDFCDFPLQQATLEDVEAWPFPSPDDYDYSSIPRACSHWRDDAIVLAGAGMGDIINTTGAYRTMEQAMIDLITDDPVFMLLTKRRLENDLEILHRSLEAGKGHITLLCIGEDLGSQNGPMIGPDIYRKHLRPWQEKFTALARSFDVPVMIHSCGSSSWAFNDFIDIGISVVDTLQPEARDMAPSYLKRAYGEKLAFHGCISTAGPVSFGTPQQVIDDVRNTLEIMMPGSGYCFSPTHDLQDNSPVENVVAMYEAAQRFGKY